MNVIWYCGGCGRMTATSGLMQMGADPKNLSIPTPVTQALETLKAEQKDLLRNFCALAAELKREKNYIDEMTVRLNAAEDRVAIRREPIAAPQTYEYSTRGIHLLPERRPEPLAWLDEDLLCGDE